MTYCLDAWPVVAWLADEEPAASRVDDVLPERPVMSWINVGEVHYLVARCHGRGDADDAVAFLRRRLRLDSATPARVVGAAAIKADHAISYADAFAVATSLAYDAVLLTGDPEILAASAGWRTEDLRPRT